MNEPQHTPGGGKARSGSGARPDGPELLRLAGEAYGVARASEALGLALSAAEWCASHGDRARLIEAAELIGAAGERVRIGAFNTAASDGVRVVSSQACAPEPLVSGCYLIEPPLVGIDAASLGEIARASGESAIAIAREPLSKTGLRPVVVVGRVIIRVRIKDAASVESPGVEWYVGACERLSEAALESVVGVEPALHRAMDLLDVLSALPHDEEAARMLAVAAREAGEEPVPVVPRRRAVLDDPTSF